MRNTAAWSACPRRCCGSLLLFCGPRPSGRLQRQQKEGPAEARTRQHPGCRHLLPSRHSSGPQEQLEAARRGYRNRMLLGQFTLRRYPRLQNKYKSGSNNLSKKMCPAGGNTGTQINQLSIDGGFFLFILRACCNFHIKLFLKQPSLLYSNWSISMKFLCFIENIGPAVISCQRIIFSLVQCWKRSGIYLRNVTMIYLISLI